MIFNAMLELLRKNNSRKWRRAGWADVAMGDGSIRGSMWVEMRQDEENRPFAVLMLRSPERTIQAPRWTATLTDKAASDWEEVIDESDVDMPMVREGE